MWRLDPRGRSFSACWSGRADSHATGPVLGTPPNITCIDSKSTVEAFAIAVDSAPTRLLPSHRRSSNSGGFRSFFLLSQGHLTVCSASHPACSWRADPREMSKLRALDRSELRRIHHCHAVRFCILEDPAEQEHTQDIEAATRASSTCRRFEGLLLSTVATADHLRSSGGSIQPSPCSFEGIERGYKATQSRSTQHPSHHPLSRIRSHVAKLQNTSPHNSFHFTFDSTPTF